MGNNVSINNNDKEDDLSYNFMPYKDNKNNRNKLIDAIYENN
jgi:hypothetical protein